MKSKPTVKFYIEKAMADLSASDKPNDHGLCKLLGIALRGWDAGVCAGVAENAEATALAIKATEDRLRPSCN